MIVGVDEAGRGCPIGPLVLCAAGIPELEEYNLKELGVKDSKKMSAAARKRIYPQILKLCKYTLIKVRASELNELMGRYSLNEIEAMKIGEVLNISHFPAGSTVYVDSPDNIPKNFALRIEKYLKKKFNIVSENYAERKHPIVAAASIIAKVRRDREIEKIKKIVKYDFSSGYASDPITIAYLEKHADDARLKPFLRKRWKTFRKMKQKKLEEF